MPVISPSDDLSSQQRIRHIIQTIRSEEQSWRQRYPILRYQSVIGLAILLGALAGMLGAAVLYYLEWIPAWACIIVAALCASLSHEIEHDLIHRQYFRHQPIIYHGMMLLTWLMRPNTVNPWYRRNMHLLHHKVSGTPKDLEERLVGNGITWGLSRFIVMFDGLLGLCLRHGILRRETDNFSMLKLLAATFPLASLYFLTWYTFLLFHTYDALFAGVGGISATVYPETILWLLEGINFAVVVLIAPNVIRSACLNLITSHMHYYGNVQNLLQQTQILDHWYLLPLQLFCFNFGRTHSIHHFVVSQPFYLRQLVAGRVLKVMRKQGIRRNDLSTLRTGNGWHNAPAVKTAMR
ncbi:fatty acid desaturase [Lacimicrobium sp. SS2-24]|uniref:fatty acid desaturase n=1 Tax=Lacimicrobium sp. SS2-24 TaxID=2005569 RepID=UPI000B4BAF3F|nr:fatty acid desaturase [Lacimicrobium sp. SS2-24]